MKLLPPQKANDQSLERWLLVLSIQSSLLYLISEPEYLAIEKLVKNMANKLELGCKLFSLRLKVGGSAL